MPLFIKDCGPSVGFFVGQNFRVITDGVIVVDCRNHVKVGLRLIGPNLASNLRPCIPARIDRGEHIADIGPVRHFCDGDWLDVIGGDQRRQTLCNDFPSVIVGRTR